MRWTISWHPHADGLTGATREMQEYATPAKELSHAYVGWPGGQLFILSKDMEVFVFRIDEGQQVDEGMASRAVMTASGARMVPSPRQKSTAVTSGPMPVMTEA